DDGEIIGTLLAWQIGPAAIDADEATSPRTATTLFCEISFETVVAASSDFDWSSSVRILTLRPLMPPAALTSSAAMMMPLCVDVPKVACEPLSEPYSPMRMSPVADVVAVDAVAPPVSLFGGQPASDSDS